MNLVVHKLDRNVHLQTERSARNSSALPASPSFFLVLFFLRGEDKKKRRDSFGPRFTVSLLTRRERERVGAHRNSCLTHGATAFHNIIRRLLAQRPTLFSTGGFRDARKPDGPSRRKRRTEICPICKTRDGGGTSFFFVFVIIERSCPRARVC